MSITSDLFYGQSRLYLALGRHGLLPEVFAKVHSTRHTPIHAQVWVGVVASVLAGLFNVRVLSHILSVGSLVRASYVLIITIICLSILIVPVSDKVFSSR